MTYCTGTAEDHCCYFGSVCVHLEENTVPGRRWACGLMRKYQSWDAVYASPEWPEVLAQAVAHNLGEDYRCGDWPPVGQVCSVCGVKG